MGALVLIWKGPCFGGLTFKNRGHLASRYIVEVLVEGFLKFNPLTWRIHGPKTRNFHNRTTLRRFCVAEYTFRSLIPGGTCNKTVLFCGVEFHDGSKTHRFWDTFCGWNPPIVGFLATQPVHRRNDMRVWDSMPIRLFVHLGSVFSCQLSFNST